MRTFSSVKELKGLVGQEIGVTQWIAVEQSMIDALANVVGDCEPTYVGRTIAQPALLLGLITQLVGQVVAFNASMPTTFSYGFNRIGFPRPTLSGEKVRLRLGLSRIQPFRGGVQMAWSLVFEVEGADQPSLTAEWLTQTYFHLQLMRRLKTMLGWFGIRLGAIPNKAPLMKATAVPRPADAPICRVHSIQEVADLAGTEVGVSRAIIIDQRMIDAFADVTGDYYWTHSDPERCKRDSPYGQTIAHGALMLGLIPQLVGQIVTFTGAASMTTVGFDRVRYPAPALSGAKFRLRLALGRIDTTESTVQLHWTVLFQAEDAPKPCLAADWITHALMPSAPVPISATKSRTR